MNMTQDEVTKFWPKTDIPVVTVICTTYNHANYIAKALDGFLMQKTTFPFEVLVHDDASPDGTADIIREYEKAYPSIIKAVYQQVNQYSQGIKITETFLRPMIRGRYIAICEGDDFWTDPLKLQKQVDFLETNPDYSGCVHRGVIHMMQGNDPDFISPRIAHERDLSLEEIVTRSSGPILTCSNMFRSKYLILPECFYSPKFGDYQRHIYMALCGKVRCLADVMCQYNNLVPGSYTEKDRQKKKEGKLDYTPTISLLQNIDTHYEYQYHDIFKKQIDILQCKYLFYMGRKKEAKQYKEYYKKLVFAARMQKIKPIVTKIPGGKKLWVWVRTKYKMKKQYINLPQLSGM